MEIQNDLHLSCDSGCRYCKMIRYSIRHHSAPFHKDKDCRQMEFLQVKKLKKRKKEGMLLSLTQLNFPLATRLNYHYSYYD